MKTDFNILDCLDRGCPGDNRQLIQEEGLVGCPICKMRYAAFDAGRALGKKEGMVCAAAGQPFGIRNTGVCPWEDGDTVYYHLRDGIGYSIAPETLDWSLDADNPIVLSFKGIQALAIRNAIKKREN